MYDVVGKCSQIVWLSALHTSRIPPSFVHARISNEIPMKGYESIQKLNTTICDAPYGSS